MSTTAKPRKGAKPIVRATGPKPPEPSRAAVPAVLDRLIMDLEADDADAWDLASRHADLLILDYGVEILRRAAALPLDAQPAIYEMPNIPGREWPGDRRGLRIDEALGRDILRIAGELGVSPEDWAYSAIIAESLPFRKTEVAAELVASKFAGYYTPSKKEMMEPIWFGVDEGLCAEAAALAKGMTWTDFSEMVLLQAAKLPPDRQAKRRELPPEAGNKRYVRFSREEREMIRQAARDCGMSMKAWLYSNLMDAVGYPRTASDDRLSRVQSELEALSERLTIPADELAALAMQEGVQAIAESVRTTGKLVMPLRLTVAEMTGTRPSRLKGGAA